MPADEKATRRYNAWNWPPSKRLLITISVCLADAVAFGLFLSPLLDAPVRWIFTAIFAFSFIVTMAAGAWTMTRDPIDHLVLEAEAGIRIRRDEEVLYCQYCRAHVGLDSKHCWDCNKCVENFDHHCPWLNTCIGTRNYGGFYISIWSLLVMLGIASAAGLLVVLQATAIDAPTNALGLDHQTTLVIGVVLLVVNGPLCFLDMTLVAFHTFLVVKNITTYDYLTQKTSKKKAKFKDLEQKEKRLKEKQLQSDAGRNLHVFPRAQGTETSGQATGGASGSPYRAGAGLPAASYARQETYEGGSSSSEGESSSDDGGGGVQGLDPFRSLTAQEGDSEMKKEFSSVIFGSRTSSVAVPEMTPRAPSSVSMQAQHSGRPDELA